ncbi:MAG: glucose-1-phosphate thymidylyltransferase RfbA [Rhodobacteraceae bacterium]|nr:glucose-1-phosphate thymidylyltransferase RfbA [Paracoccaceae bacterium]
MQFQTRPEILTEHVRKGIVIAGGLGSRVYPMTVSTSKCLLPVYSKPMVYYPVGVLMLAGIREILLICHPRDRDSYELLFGDGSRWGMSLSYLEQRDPRGGIAEAFLIGADFIGSESCALALGDNVFIGSRLPIIMRRAAETVDGAMVFATQVADPRRYGIVTFDSAGRPNGIEEKPENPRSDWAVTGLYFYDNQVIELASRLKPSDRGELEISDVNQAYLDAGRLRVEKLSRGIAWYDAGTPDSLFEAAIHVRTIERNQRHSVLVPEEIAFDNGWINQRQLIRLSQHCPNSDYARYLARLASEDGSEGIAYTE